MIQAALRFLLRTIAALVAGSALIVAIGAWRLSSGPVSIGFLSGYLQEAMSFSGADGFQLKIDDTILTWAGLERGLDIRVIEVTLLDADGVAAATIPEMALGLDGRQLLQGRLVPRTVDVLSPVLRLVRNADGLISFGVGAPREEGATSRLLDRLIQELILPPDSSRPVALLERLQVENARLIVQDAGLRRVWVFPRVDADFLRHEFGIDGNLDIELALADRRFTFTADGAFDYIRQSLELGLRFNDIVPADLSAAAAEFSILEKVQLPVSGNITFEIASDGSLSPLRFSVEGGEGRVFLDPFLDKAVEISEMAAKGIISPSLDAIELTELTGRSKGARADVTARLFVDDGDPVLEISGAVAGVDTEMAHRYWPTRVGPFAREWFHKNIRGGRMTEGTVAIRIAASDIGLKNLPPGTFQAQFAFENGTAELLSGFPLLENATGIVVMTQSSFEASLDAGGATLGGLFVSEGTIKLTREAWRKWHALIEGVASGENSQMMEVLNSGSLDLANRFGLSSVAIGGLAATRARFEFPIRPDLQPSDVQFVVAANLRGTSIEGVMPGIDMTDGSLTLQVNAAGMVVEGAASLNGVAAQVRWEEVFAANQKLPAQISVSGQFDETDRIALGIPTFGVIDGVVGVEAFITSLDRQFVAADFSLDLTAARLNLGPLLWEKPANIEGELTFSLRPAAGNGILVENIELKAIDLLAMAEIELNFDRSLRRLDLNRLRFGGNDLAASVRPQAPDGFIVAVNGNSIDVGPYLDAFFSSEDIGDVPPVRLSIDLKEMIISPERRMQDLSGEIIYGPIGLDSVQMVGILNQVAPLTLLVTTDQTRQRKLTVATSDAGALARTTGLFRKAEGGTLRIDADIDARGELPIIEGRMEVTEISINDAPALARLLTLASLTGILEAMSGDGINFVRADIPFSYREGVLNITDARAFGPALGITMEGKVDPPGDEIALYGTLVPAYTINRILGSIPLIGTFLVGREGEGVFAITYDVKGTIDEPVVVINPLTALAPGFLRNFFSIFRGTGGPSPSNEADPDVL